MLLGGDEIGRTQHGNNNAYCQDNETQLVRLGARRCRAARVQRRLIALRQAHPVFRRRRWFQGRPIHGEEVADIAWFTPDGSTMNDEHWGERIVTAIGLLLSGDGLGDRDERASRSATTRSTCCSTRTRTRCRGVHRRATSASAGADRLSTPPTRCRSARPGRSRDACGLPAMPDRDGRSVDPAAPRAAHADGLRAIRGEHAARDLPPPAPAMASTSTTPRRSLPYLAALGVQPRLPVAVSSRRRRAARTATTWSTRGRSTPSSAARSPSSASARRRRRRGSAWCSTSCPTTWRSAPDNPWWWDVLENGRASRYARFISTSSGTSPSPISGTAS